MVNDNVVWISFFCENCQFEFFGVGSKNYHVSLDFFSHSKNHLGFQNLKKNSVR